MRLYGSILSHVECRVKLVMGDTCNESEVKLTNILSCRQRR